MILSLLRHLMLPLRQINDFIPDSGLNYELGSGYGVISTYLANSHSQRSVIAVDIDSQKINLAHKKNINKNLDFVVADIHKFKLELCHGVVLSDFLHHLAYATHEDVIKKIYSSLVRGGVLVIKEIDDNDGLRKWLSRFWDMLLYPKDRIYYRSKAEWSSLLRKYGFTISIMRTVWWFPGSSYLFICKKN